MTMPDPTGGSNQGLDNGDMIGAEGGDTPPEQQQDVAGIGSEGSPPSTSESEEVKFNPAWNGLLEKIPEQFHHLIAGDLKQWDRNYNSLAQQYAPWKAFNTQGVTPDSLQKAYQVYQTINNNPMEVYRRLGEALKDQLPSQSQQTQQQNQANQNSSSQEYDQYSDEDDSDSPTDPNYKSLQKKFDQLQQMVQNDFQTRRETQMSQQYEQQIDSMLNQIEETNGAFDKSDVLQRVAAQMQMGQQPDIIKAYQEQQAFINHYTNQVQQTQQQNSPPIVNPPNGGTPSTSQTANADTSTEEGRKARFAELLRMAQMGQG